MVAHELTEVDVVAFMNWSERGGYDDVNSCPTLALSGGLS